MIQARLFGAFTGLLSLALGASSSISIGAELPMQVKKSFSSEELTGSPDNTAITLLNEQGNYAYGIRSVSNKVLIEPVAYGLFPFEESLLEIAPDQSVQLLDVNNERLLAVKEDQSQSVLMSCLLFDESCINLKTAARPNSIYSFGQPSAYLNDEGVAFLAYKADATEAAKNKISFFFQAQEVVAYFGEEPADSIALTSGPEPAALGLIGDVAYRWVLHSNFTVSSLRLPEPKELGKKIVPLAINNAGRIVVIEAPALSEQGEILYCDFAGPNLSDPEVAECEDGYVPSGIIASAGMRWFLSENNILYGNLTPVAGPRIEDPSGVIINLDNNSVHRLDEIVPSEESLFWSVLDVVPSGDILAMSTPATGDGDITWHVLTREGVDSDTDGFFDLTEEAAGFDAFDAFSHPASGPDRFVDTDGDGTEDYLDANDDGDLESDIWERDNGYDWRDPADFADADGDGFTLAQESQAGSDPDDIFSVPVGVVPYFSFAAGDLDGDGIANYQDIDDDGDGLTDYWEYKYGAIYGLDWQVDDSALGLVDSDGDGFLDVQEQSYGTEGDPQAHPNLEPALVVDSDGDGIQDYADRDDDGDGYLDWDDDLPYDPTDHRDADSDLVGDGVDNCVETANTNQFDFDVDGQGDACDTDDDNDGMSDAFELAHGLNPFDDTDWDSDTDGDGYVALQEFLGQTDPTEVASHPGLPDGAIAYYPLAAYPGRENVLRDVAGGDALDMAVTERVTRLPGNGIALTDVGEIVRTDGPATKLYSSITASGEFTVEAWVRNAGMSMPYPGPWRIASYSGSNLHRNFTLGQAGDQYAARIRTGITGDNGYHIEFGAVSEVEPQHVVMAYDGAVLRLYVDGELAREFSVSDGLSVWDSSFPLVLGDEDNGDRAWAGELYQLAIYDRALNESDVTRRYGFGHMLADFDSDGVPDVADDYPLDPAYQYDQDSDGLADVLDNCPATANINQFDFDVDGQGDACDADDDNDGMSDSFELAYGLNPFDDSDWDGDVDADGYVALQEYLGGTDPTDAASNPGLPEGAIAYYPFAVYPGYEDILRDFAGGDALDMAVTERVTRLPGNGIALSDAGEIVRTSGAATKLYNAIMASGEFAVEAWVRNESLSRQSATPWRIVSNSGGATTRNFTLGQDYGQYAGRLRTETGHENQTYHFGSASDTDPQHVVMSYDGAVLRLYVDGALQREESLNNDLALWDSSLPLLLGDEAGGGRVWEGELFQLAIYDRALSATDIVSRHDLGHMLTDIDEDGVPDVVDDYPFDAAFQFNQDGDELADSADNCPAVANNDQSNFDGDELGDLCDPDDDNDGLSDADELSLGLDPYDPSDALSDADSDGYSLSQEIQQGTDPLNPASLPISTNLDIPIASTSDEHEEDPATGQVYAFSSTDLGIGVDAPAGEGIVGLRFQIDMEDIEFDSAYIQFERHASQGSGTADFHVSVEDSVDAPAFSQADYDITSRSYMASVSWPGVPEWDGAVTAEDMRTPDLAAQINQVIADPQWAAGNHVVVKIEGTGYRNAAPFEDAPARLLLAANWEQPAYPLDTDGDGLPNHQDIDDDNDSMPDAWEYAHGLNWLDPSDSGDYLSAVTDPDGDGFPSIVEFEYGSHPNDDQSVPLVELRFATGANLNDAHEKPNGDVRSINRLFFDQGHVGLRYALDVTSGLDIREAYVQFTPYSTGDESGVYQIGLEDSSDAAAFDASEPFDISSRSISTSVAWSAGDWGATGVATEVERTPDISSLIQAAVEHPSWAPGNHIGLIISGSGNHRARGWDYAGASQAPKLVLRVPATYQQLQDFDGDGLRNYEDPDDDNDGLLDAYELANGLDPYDATDAPTSFDADGDGFSYDQEVNYGTSDSNPAHFPQGGSVSLDLLPGADDGEEDSRDSSVNLDYNTLLLGAYDQSDPWLVGLRYYLPITQDALVTEASVQFGSAQTESGTTVVDIGIQDADDAEPILSTSGNLSDRSLIPNSVPWDIPPWGYGDLGADQRSPDISQLINTIISRAGWAAGNHVLITFQGEEGGSRYAASRNSYYVNYRPVLNIDYVIKPEFFVDSDGDGIEDYLDTN